MKPASKRELANFRISAYRFSICRATAVIQRRQATYFYRPPTLVTIERNGSVSARLPSRVFAMAHTASMSCLRRKGWRINHKKTDRIYCEEGLNLRRKRSRQHVAARLARLTVSSLNACWSMDFVADQLFNGQRSRALTVVDNFSRESLAITVDFVLKAEDVIVTI